MNILVTGVSGFVGGHIARYLVNKGHHVTGISRREIPSKKISHIRADLTKPIREHLPCTSYDTVIHSAALTEFNAPYKKAYSVNVTGTQNAYALAKQIKAKKFIHLSSFSVYQEFTDRYRVDEEFPKARATASSYSQTKLEAERFLEKQENLPVVCLRPHIIYGPGDTSVLSQFLSMIKFNRLFLPIETPKEVSVTYVKNLVEGIEFFLERKIENNYVAYNISDKKKLDSLTLISNFLAFSAPETKIVLVPKVIGYGSAQISTIIARFQQQTPKLTTDLVHQLNNNSSSSTKKLSGLGFTPKFSFEIGLKATSDWYNKFTGIKEFLSDSEKVWPKI